MYVYLKDENKIVDTDVCEVVEDYEDLVNARGYYYGPKKFLAPDGTEFWLDRPQFSNLPYRVWQGDREDELAETHENIEFPENIDYFVNRADELDDDTLSPEERKEIEEEVEEYENYIPKSAKEILDAHNLYMGASSTNDYNYRNYQIFQDGQNNFYVKSVAHGFEGVAMPSQEELERLLLAIWDNWGYEKALKIITNNRSYFNDIEVVDEELITPKRKKERSVKMKP